MKSSFREETTAVKALRHKLGVFEIREAGRAQIR